MLACRRRRREKKCCAWSKSSSYEMSNIYESKMKRAGGNTKASDKCRMAQPKHTQKSVIGL
jgi:hypothetical protein